MYTYNTEVRYSQIDSDALMTLSAMVDDIQDCSTMHVAKRGMPTMKLRQEHNQAWILNSWQIVIERRPKLGELIDVSTIPYEFKGGCGFRNFLIEDENKEKIVKVNSVWTLINATSGFPMRVSDEAKTGIELDEKLDMEYLPRKIELPEGEFKENGIVEVKRSQLDTNNHVNNARYIDIALDYIPEDLDVYMLRVQYNLPARKGDKIVVKTYSKDKLYYVLLESMDKELYVALEFTERTK